MAAPGFFRSTPAEVKKIPNFSPEVEAQLDNYLRQSGVNLQDLISRIKAGPPNQNQFEFEPIAQYARHGFQTKTAPTITERFTQMGGPGTRPGSALFNALGGAGKELDLGLGALKSQYLAQQQQQQNQYNLAQQGLESGLYQNLLGLGLTPRSQNLYEPEQTSIFKQLLMALPQLAGTLGGAYLGGPAGAAAGAALGGVGKQATGGDLGPVALQAAGSPGYQFQKLANAQNIVNTNDPFSVLGIQNPLLQRPNYLYANQR